MWGPKFSDNDVPDELDQGKIFPEELFSTFQHEKDEECPAFRDNSKVIINELSTTKNNKIKYPCNIGGCEKDCECDPCPITILIILKSSTQKKTFLFQEECLLILKLEKAFTDNLLPIHIFTHPLYY